MKNYTGITLAEQPGSRQVMKKPLHVRVCFAHTAGSVQTLEGPVPYASGDALLTGVAGESWPVTRERFLHSYQAVPPTVSGHDGLYTKRPIAIWGLQVHEDFFIDRADDHARLCGTAGDWILQYAADDYGVIKDHIFTSSYTLLGSSE